MARADVVTLLELDRYAQIMNLNPLHFNGARLPQITGEPLTVAPDWSERPLWKQFGYQNTSTISRDQLARTIQQAEFDIAKFLGYWPAPMWSSQEVHMYPRPNFPEFYGSGLNVRGQLKSIKTDFAKIIAVGPRTVTLVATATVAGGSLVYSDPNSDGWDTLATITVTTTLTDACELKLYFANQSGSPLWEIRPLRSVSISGGVATITVDSWLLFDPDVTNAFPTGEITSIDASESANYVTSVEVRREFADFTGTSVEMFWEREPGTQLAVIPTCCPVCAGTGCEACSLVTMNGCLAIRNAEDGVVAIAPATYDEVDARWEKERWGECREPDQVKIWYRSGLQSELGLRGDCNKLDNAMARTIAILATARLGWGFKAVSGISSVIDYWQRDQSESFPDGSTIFTPPDILSNPFGTRRGEVEVYRSLFHMRERKLPVSAVAA